MDLKKEVLEAKKDLQDNIKKEEKE